MEFISGNVFIRPNAMPKAGDVCDGHTHNFDHTTIVFKGAVHVRKVSPDGTVMEKDFRAPDFLLIRAEDRHEITALEDGTEFWCVYSHRNAQGEVTQTATGWEKAYQ